MCGYVNGYGMVTLMDFDLTILLSSSQGRKGGRKESKE